MAFLDGIFGNKPQQQSLPGGTGVNPPQNQPQPNNNQQAQPNNNNGSGGPAGGQPQGGANSQVDGGNPLDPFTKLLTPSKEVNDAQAARAAEKNKGLFGDSFNPESVTKAMSGMDFTTGIDVQGLSAKVLAGDPAALAELLNGVTRNAVSASVQMSHGMVEKGVSTGIERFGGDMDSRMRDYTLRNQNADNPALQHPIGKAFLSSAKQQIAQANPRMSADEVHTQAVKMFTELSTMMTSGGKEGKESASGPKEMDWSLFLEGGDQNAAQH